MGLSGDGVGSHDRTVPILATNDEMLSNTCTNLRKLPIGFRQIPGTHNRDQVAYLEGVGTGGDRWLETHL